MTLETTETPAEKEPFAPGTWQVPLAFALSIIAFPASLFYQMGAGFAGLQGGGDGMHHEAVNLFLDPMGISALLGTALPLVLVGYGVVRGWRTWRAGTIIMAIIATLLSIPAVILVITANFTALNG